VHRFDLRAEELRGDLRTVVLDLSTARGFVVASSTVACPQSATGARRFGEHRRRELNLQRELAALLRLSLEVSEMRSDVSRVVGKQCRFKGDQRCKYETETPHAQP
jgi:hypothetical protein